MTSLVVAVLAMVGLFQPVIALQVQVGDPVDQVLSRIKRQRECQQADVVFVLDKSGSIGLKNWKVMISFIVNIVDAFTIGENDVRIGVITFGGMAVPQIHLNEYYDKSELIQAINAIKYDEKITNTYDGILKMHSVMFTPEHGDRPNVKNLGIVVTDGQTTKEFRPMTIPEANVARSKGIMLMAIGISKEVNRTELLGIANVNPRNRRPYVFQVETFDALPVIRQELLSAACEAKTDCRMNADVTFILDVSGNIGVNKFNAVNKAIQNIISRVNVFGATKIGMISYGAKAKMMFQMGHHDRRAHVVEAVQNMKFVSGERGSDLAGALRMARDQIFATNKNRPENHDLIVLFTNGEANDFKKALDMARDLRNREVEILVVSTSNWMGMSELQQLASDPAELNVLKATKMEELDRLVDPIRKAICDSVDECARNPCRNRGICTSGLNNYHCECIGPWAGIHCDIPCSVRSDVVLAMDASSSMNKQNFYLMQTFGKKLAMSLPINREDHTRFGVMLFSNKAEVKYHLQQYRLGERAANAISFTWPMGKTNTAAALARIREDMFNPNNGDRSGAQNVGIFVTDGHSEDRLTTFTEAAINHLAGNTLMAVGIGVTHSYDKLEIEGIASDPDEKTIFYTRNYTTLVSDVPEKIVRAICSADLACRSNPCQGGGQCMDKVGGYDCRCPASRSGKNCERMCSGVADVVFMLDSSGSIRRPRFEMMKDYTKNIINELEVRPDRTRIGLLIFNDKVSVEFQLNSYGTKEDVLQAIERMEWMSGKTNIADAINTMRTVMFQESNGNRRGVPDFGILLSDGEATVNKGRTLPEAIQARVSGIHMIVVAAEAKHMTLEMKGIASSPIDENVHIVGSFNGLNTMTSQIVNGLCDDEDECRFQPCRRGRCINGLKEYVCICNGEYTGVNCERRCNARVDVAFILDSSGSVEKIFDKQMKLARRIVQGLNFDGRKTRVAVTTFSDNAQVRFTFNYYMEKLGVLNAIAFTLSGGKTNLAEAMRVTRRDVFSRSRGDRTDPNYVVLMTDGFPTVSKSETIPEADRLKRQSNAKMLVVGIGKDLNRNMINEMSSYPSSENTFELPDETRINEVADRILDQICR